MKPTVIACSLFCSISMAAVVLAAEPQQPPKTLADQLNAVANASAKRFPAELLQSMEQAIDSVRQSGIEKSARQVGDEAIDATLTDWNGKQVTLSDLWSEGPIVLMWYRGGWCPYCNLQLRGMQQQLESLEENGAKLVVLSPELPKYAKQTAKANKVDFITLFDQGNATARKYGLVFELPESILPLYRDRLKLAERNGSDAMELPLSATYVIDRGGVIRYAFLDADYKKRAEPAEVVDAVRKLGTKTAAP